VQGLGLQALSMGQLHSTCALNLKANFETRRLHFRFEGWVARRFQALWVN
jgi:hypothetical protein